MAWARCWTSREMSRLQREPSKWTRLGHQGALWLPRQLWQQKDQEIRSMKLLWMVGQSHSCILYITSLDQKYIGKHCTGWHIQITSQDVKNLPNSQGSPLTLNIDLMFSAIEHDKYDWISIYIYICIHSISFNFLYWIIIQD